MRCHAFPLSCRSAQLNDGQVVLPKLMVLLPLSTPLLKCAFIFFQVVDIMRVNVDKVLERDQKLSELDDRAGKSCNSMHVMITS